MGRRGAYSRRKPLQEKSIKRFSPIKRVSHISTIDLPIQTYITKSIPNSKTLISTDNPYSNYYQDPTSTFMINCSISHLSKIMIMKSATKRNLEAKSRRRNLRIVY